MFQAHVMIYDWHEWLNSRSSPKLQQAQRAQVQEAEILAVLPGMQMGPSEGFVRYLANLTGVFREGGQQAVYDTLREKGEQSL
jgi:hypothetical protein